MPDRDFWQERWDEGRIGFHMGRPHPSLERHLGHLDLDPTHRVLVPLAGKAADLDLLARHAGRVFANEYIETAARQFFEERGMTPDVVGAEGRRRITAGAITFLCQDFFALQPDDLEGPVEACFDRAALVAVGPADRPAYATQLARLVAPGGRLLLVVFAYDQARLDGPPYSVPPEEVHTLFEPCFDVRPLERSQAEVGPKFHEAGIPTIEEHTLLLLRR
jgi:thiopurine S-methyltransferase